MDYLESVNYLISLGHEVLAAKYGLENIRLLLEKLGHPERSFKSIIIAGTNGKGSVAAMIESIARSAQHKTALFTSPHMVRIEERMCVNGEEISRSDFARLATRVRAAGDELVLDGRLQALPTFFEQVTAIALCYFAQQEVGLAILEVGLGGRLDSTNAVDRILSVITSIDYDHQNILGNSIAEIASEKAAIIERGARVVIGRQQHEAATEVLMRRCLEVGSLPVFANEPVSVGVNDFGRLAFDYESSQSHYSRVVLGLRGRHQTSNAAAAIEAAEVLTELGLKITRDSIIKGLRDVKWPGRLELIDARPALLLDGAHNPAGARSLGAFLNEFWHKPLTLVFGAMSDKDIDGMVKELFPLANTIVLTRVKDQRAASHTQLGKSALSSSQNVIFTESVRQALSWANSVTPPDGLICVAGSLYLVGEVKRLLESEDSRGNI